MRLRDPEGLELVTIPVRGGGALGLLFGLVTVPIISTLLLGVLFLAVIAYFLFRPAGSAWFQQGAPMELEQP
ncbi:hypothetical protein G7077_09225 [Sphingomonas piscis]|uniref:Uncharacterized protein n=1 Tax=Sphingomonas piscis TaxID=2714943 RepID=A0A6G7YQN9_9SPHN|nr:hypothetical protein [Sphingomonas piscis]QIK79047.1 hypothetical protein G7077_09225 [Sphingomonas piscis]